LAAPVTSPGDLRVLAIAAAVIAVGPIEASFFPASRAAGTLPTGLNRP
jgi:hypothetical protein